MPEYLAYTIGRDGHFTGVEPIVGATDAEAIEKANRLVGGQDVELWNGARLVIRLNRKPM
jgi:alkanesulfonate monooxygenase SsuD/methylene tetrahydromethanopterin reductase-like flavin-dependent oxidoreductase (luciferase family)